MISVQLLGGACLRSGDTILGGPPTQRHRIALLSLVVSAWPQPLSRDRAMALLWPERDLAGARRLLNLAVHVLRSTLGTRVIATSGAGLVFHPAGVHCDLHELRAAIAAHDHARIAELYAGPLLDGFHLEAASEFAHWLDAQRRDLSHEYVGALLALADAQARAGDVHGRVGTCRRLTAEDPYSASHAQALVRALDEAGDRAGAVRHAAEYARRMRADLDLEPDPAVAALAEELRAPVTTPTPARAAPTPPARPRSVAVLPFLNLTGDQENEYFVDGITEDVIAGLSKLRGLHVIARASVQPFKQRQATLKEIARTLGAATLLDGSVRHLGDRVRIVAALVDADRDRQIWAETYDRMLTDIFAIQSEVALRIAGALDTELSRDEEARVRRAPTASLQAYRLFAKGREWFIRFTPESLRRAIEFFELALAQDPGFALAHAHRAMAYVELAEGGALDPEDAYRRAAGAAARALELDPELGAAHCTSAYLRMVRDFDWTGAEREFRHALTLSPSSAETHDLYGRLCAGLGRHDEAIALLRRAHELDPLAHRVDIVTALIRAGRYDEAIVRGEEETGIDPSDARALATLGWAYFLAGRKEEGLRALERAVAASPGTVLWFSQLGSAYAMAGQTSRARDVLRTVEQRARSDYVSPYHLAYIHTGLGDAERALDCLERAVAQRTGPAYAIKASFLFAPLHGHPRFEALLQRMHLG